MNRNKLVVSTIVWLFFVATLSAKDYQVSMVTGDNEVSARVIASELGISNVYAGASPEDKEI